MAESTKIAKFMVKQCREYLCEFYGVEKEGHLPIELVDFYEKIIAIYGASAELLIKEYSNFEKGDVQ